MADQRVVDFVRPRWCLIRLATASDQYLAINQTFGTFASFSEANPGANDWFKFLIIPRDVGRNEFWLFSKAAQSGSGELVSDSHRGLAQWGFEGKDSQCFNITPLASYDKDRMVRLTVVSDDRVVSTRWSAQAFLWNLTDGDKQQMLHLVDGGPIPMPTVPDIEGVPGNMDRELLRVDSFDATEVVETTPPRVVATELIPFPFVQESYTHGRQMRETPYYLMTRRCFWKKVKSREFPAAGEKEEELTWEVGLEETESSAVETSLLVKIGAKASYKAEAGLAGELSFAQENGEKWTKRSEVERYEKQTGRHLAKYAAGNRVLVVVWALANRYTLTRANGDVLGEVEFIEKGDEIARSHMEHVDASDTIA
jgi:hypothetical protein